MKKLTSLIIALVASMCSLTAWAEITAPVIQKTPSAPFELDKEYYMYNVGSGLFLDETDNNPIAQTYGRKVTIHQVGDGLQIIYAHNSRMLWAESTTTTTATYGTSWYDCFTITAVDSIENGYVIQKDQKNGTYNANEYIGYDGSDDKRIKPNMTEGNIVWQFIDAELVEHEMNRGFLYLELEQASKYNFVIDVFEAIYNNENSTIEEINAATKSLKNSNGMSQGYKARYWNEYPILWATSAGNFGQDPYNTWALPNRTQDINGNTIYYSSGEYFDTWFNSSTGSRTLSATVNVAEPATFVYSTGGTSDYDSKIQVYVDDVLVRTLVGPQIDTYPSGQTYTRFFEMLQPGTHTIKWVASTTNSYSQSFSIRYAGVVNSPLITVSLLEPGSLGTEVLYNTDHIKNVRRLKVIGKMNDDDWAKLKMMSGLLDLDLSEAEFTEVPEGQFRVTYNDTVMQFLHRLVLPEGVTKINKEAFYYSFIDTLALPSTLRNIRENAFGFSHIQEIDMPDDCTEIYGDENNNGSVFGNMRWLRKLKCAKNWTVIPRWTFGSCYFLEEVTLPEKLEAIGYGAFDYDRYMTINFPEGLKRINDNAFCCCYNANFGAFPEGLETIGSSAFQECHGIVDLVVPGSVSFLGSYAFQHCSNLKKAELGVRQYALSDRIFYGCNKLENLRLNSPTVATVTSDSYYYPVEAGRLKDVDLIVPSFLVNAYKLDKYWYNFKSITGFSTAEIQDWVINNPLVLNHDRFDGTPNITIAANYDRKPSLKFNGTNPQNINNLKLEGYHDYYNGNYPGQIYANGNNIRVNGDVQVHLWTTAKRWYFFSLPFDVKVSDITHSAGDVQYKIGYYDGAERALYGTNGSWKDAKGKPITDTEGWDLTTEYTETLNSCSDYRIYGTSVTIGENGEVDYSTTSYGGVQYVRLNTNKDNQIKIRVNDGYMVTGLSITAWSDNWSTIDRSIALTGAYVDGSFSSVLSENVIFPNGRGESTATATVEDIDATKLIRLTFDNSLIVDRDEDYYGCSKQIYAKIDVTYKRIVPEVDEGMAVIPAGTGFIMQTNKDTWNFFHAVDNDMKQNLVSYTEFVKGLEVNPSEKKSNTGWNLVGNPWQCFYNSHCLNFTAPITVWDNYNSKYVAYSITDDDYAIRPNEAFFVQCPNEEYNTIGFPIQGRQFTDVIESQNAAPAMNPAMKERRLIDVVLAANDQCNDKTRVVLNEKAKLDYETACDASKFMSMDGSVPQLFTLDAEGTHYAINERPMYDGIVKMGLYVAKSGTYTISIGRCDMEKVMLVDNETGETTDISYGEYTFSTEAGTFANRFELVFDAANDPNGIGKAMADTKTENEIIYNTAGQRVNANNMRGIYIVNGKKVIK